MISDKYTIIPRGRGVQMIPKFSIETRDAATVRARNAPTRTRTRDDILTGNDPVRRTGLARTFGPNGDRTDSSPDYGVRPLEPGKNFAASEPVHAETVSPEDLSLIGKVFSISGDAARSMLDSMPKGYRTDWLDGLRKKARDNVSGDTPPVEDPDEEEATMDANSAFLSQRQFQRHATVTNTYAQRMARAGAARDAVYLAEPAIDSVPRQVAARPSPANSDPVRTFKENMERYAAGR